MKQHFRSKELGGGNASVKVDGNGAWLLDGQALGEESLNGSGVVIMARMTVPTSCPDS